MNRIPICGELPSSADVVPDTGYYAYGLLYCQSSCDCSFYEHQSSECIHLMLTSNQSAVRGGTALTYREGVFTYKFWQHLPTGPTDRTEYLIPEC
jgi:hypothetical protein